MNKNRCSSKFRYTSQGLVAAVAVWGATAHAADNSSATRDNNPNASVSSSTTASELHTPSTTANLNADVNGRLDHHDSAFIKEAAESNQAEIQMGAMAAGKAQNTEVKQLAQRLQQDHTKANQELMQLAQSKGLNLPTEPPRKEERAENRLQDKTGADFDKAFADHAIKDHEKDITRFDKALRGAKDPEVKAYIERNLPVLRQHLELARNAGNAVGVDQKVLSSADRFLSKHEGQGTAGTIQSGQSYDRSPTTTSPSGTIPKGTSGTDSTLPK